MLLPSSAKTPPEAVFVSAPVPLIVPAMSSVPLLMVTLVAVLRTTGAVICWVPESTLIEAFPRGLLNVSVPAVPLAMV